MNTIVFNKPHLTGKETKYIVEAVNSGKISGNGMFTEKCQHFFETRYHFHKVLLTSSCTDALEMAAILADIQPGDEVIVPSFTFVSTALAFVRQGAKIVFADSGTDNPNIDVSKIEELISEKTKAIVVVHYAGIACDMDRVMEIANERGLFVIEDAAQAIDSFYKGRVLGSIGHFSCFSFHETKNIQCGEGGMLVVNDEKFVRRAEIIWEKGTNRAEFFRGEINKYGWVDVGSSFLPSEITAAFLYAQLENLHQIQEQRKLLWFCYESLLSDLANSGYFKLPTLPDYATNNAHMFYITFESLEERSRLIAQLKSAGILAVFHYLSLHKSDYYQSKHDGRELPAADQYSDCLLRLPLYCDLTSDQVGQICHVIRDFYITQPIHRTDYISVN